MAAGGLSHNIHLTKERKEGFHHQVDVNIVRLPAPSLIFPRDKYRERSLDILGKEVLAPTSCRSVPFTSTSSRSVSFTVSEDGSLKSTVASNKLVLLNCTNHNRRIEVHRSKS